MSRTQLTREEAGTRREVGTPNVSLAAYVLAASEGLRGQAGIVGSNRLVLCLDRLDCLVSRLVVRFFLGRN